MDIIVPELGESIVEATVARWLKKEGEPVSTGEPLVELETDKVDLEVGAKQDGVLAKILHKEGSDVKVGEVLGIIEASKEATVRAAPAPAQEESTPVESSPKETAQTVQESQGEPAENRVSPIARRMAEEQGINLAQISASKPGERITKGDVQHFIQSREQPVPATQGDAMERETESPAKTVEIPSPPSQPTKSTERIQVDGRQEERIRMSRRRRTIAFRLVEAQQNAAMLTTFNDVDMSAVIELRKRRQEGFVKRYGIKLGFMSFFVKATIGALKAFPTLNAEIQGDEIVIKHYFDIGIAIGADEGLVVPVLRDADRMSFAEIEQALSALIEKSQQGSLTLEDLRGGTFSITNGGVYGSLLSTPILNPPQVGILGMHRIEERPIALNGQVVLRPMMYLALSYDHRIVDGREAVQFLVRIKELIQDPDTLLLEG